MSEAFARHRRAPVPWRQRVPWPPRSLTRVNLLAFCSATAVLFWPDAPSVSVADVVSVQLPRETGEPLGPVELVSVQAPVVWSDVRAPTVTTTVRNTGDEPVDARVWWLLAAPRDLAPWENTRGRSVPVDVSLPAGEAVELELPVAEPPTAGSWRLSVWAHVVPATGDDELTSHSHGAAAFPDVTVLRTGDDVLRLSPPGREVALTGLEATGRLVGDDAGAESGGEVGGEFGDEAGDGATTARRVDGYVALRSATVQPVHVEVQCYLAPPGTAEPWRAESVIASETVTTTVEAEPRTVPCRFPELPAAGSWELSAFARLPGLDHARGHQDGLYVQSAIVRGAAEDAGGAAAVDGTVDGSGGAGGAGDGVPGDGGGTTPDEPRLHGAPL